MTRLDCTLKQMEENNPIVIPRNHLIEDALSEANQLRFQKVHNLLHDLKKPYDRSYIRKKKDIPPKAHEVVQKTFCGT